MKATNMNSEKFESTYAMLVRSEEKERSLTETAVYLLLIVCTIFTAWQVAQMRVVVPERLSPRDFVQAAPATETRGV